jgi:hypothetical protein
MLPPPYLAATGEHHLSLSSNLGSTILRLKSPAAALISSVSAEAPRVSLRRNVLNARALVFQLLLSATGSHRFCFHRLPTTVTFFAAPFAVPPSHHLPHVRSSQSLIQRHRRLFFFFLFFLLFHLSFSFSSSLLSFTACSCCLFPPSVFPGNVRALSSSNLWRSETGKHFQTTQVKVKEQVC